MLVSSTIPSNLSIPDLKKTRKKEEKRKKEWTDTIQNKIDKNVINNA